MNFDKFWRDIQISQQGKTKPETKRVKADDKFDGFMAATPLSF
jgi:hypothetical protein